MYIVKKTNCYRQLPAKQEEILKSNPLPSQWQPPSKIMTIGWEIGGGYISGRVLHMGVQVQPFYGTVMHSLPPWVKKQIFQVQDKLGI